MNESIRNVLIDFLYKSQDDLKAYWKPTFFKAAGIDIKDEFESIYDQIAEQMSITDLTNKGKIAWDEFLDEYILDEISLMCDTVKDSTEENNGLISVWRAITYDKGKYADVYDNIMKEYKGGVGIYWSWDQNAAEAHWGSSSSTSKLFVLHGQVRPEDVSWPNTVYKTLYDLKEERELELNENGNIKIVGFTTTNEKNKEVYIKLDPEYVIKTY